MHSIKSIFNANANAKKVSFSIVYLPVCRLSVRNLTLIFPYKLLYANVIYSEMFSIGNAALGIYSAFTEYSKSYVTLYSIRKSR